MKYSFFCFGHENITSLHKKTIEFTKDNRLSLEGDCIVGVNADFNFDALLEFVRLNEGKKVRCELKLDGLKDEFFFYINSQFSHRTEIVIRKSHFLSERTLGIHASKSAIDVRRMIIQGLKDPGTKMEVVFDEEENNEQKGD